MKTMFRSIVALAIGMAFAFAANAQTYPVTNPTYVPNAALSSFTVASNVPATPMNLNGIGVVTLQLSGSCAALAGWVEGTVDGTNYTTLNVYPSTATTAASAVTTVTAVGVVTLNSAGYTKVRMNNTGVTGSACVGKMVGSPRDFTLPR